MKLKEHCIESGQHAHMSKFVGKTEVRDWPWHLWSASVNMYSLEGILGDRFEMGLEPMVLKVAEISPTQPRDYIVWAW